MSTHVAVVLDESGSMAAIKDALLPVFNDLTKAIVDEPNSLLTFITFATTVHVRFVADSGRRAPLHGLQYMPSGQTALLDAVGTAIDILEGEGRRNDNYLVMVFTDGQENASRRMTTGRLADFIAARQAKGNWTFAFQVPPGGAKHAERFGIPPQNIREWENTVKGIEQAGWYAQQGVQEYFKGVSRGITSSNSFYAQQPATQQVQKTLVDLTPNYHKFHVYTKYPIREFVEKIQKMSYVSGSAFYQLTKPEKVQDHKLVLVEDKRDGALYGGAEARKLVGIPPYEAKVNPAGVGNYNIYIQSTSVNRNLVPGTKLLVRR